MRNRTTVVGLVVAALVGCGGGPESGGTCDETELCDVDECKSETSYFIDETKYESKCTFGETETSITYPLAGGRGEQVTRRDLDECYYKSKYDGDDFDEKGQCTRVRDCTIATLDCDDSEPGDPDCRVVDSQSCPDRVP
jgi:hypothetical protein